jgi:hypothetical protein
MQRKAYVGFPPSVIGIFRLNTRLSAVGDILDHANAKYSEGTLYTPADSVYPSPNGKGYTIKYNLLYDTDSFFVERHQYDNEGLLFAKSVKFRVPKVELDQIRSQAVLSERISTEFFDTMRLKQFVLTHPELMIPAKPKTQ